MYEKHGRRRGLSPSEYNERLLDYSSEHKHLNYIKVPQALKALKTILPGKTTFFSQKMKYFGSE